MKEYEKPQMEIIELSGAGVFTLNQSQEEWQQPGDEGNGDEIP
jgi:hypothetical protein